MLEQNRPDRAQRLGPDIARSSVHPRRAALKCRARDAIRPHWSRIAPLLFHTFCARAWIWADASSAPRGGEAIRGTRDLGEPATKGTRLRRIVERPPAGGRSAGPRRARARARKDRGSRQ